MTNMPQASRPDGHANLIATPVRSLIERAPVTVAPETPIVEAARVMRKERISSVLLVQGGALVGLVTDRDLRDRVVAERLDIDRPVSDIATRGLRTIGVDRSAFHALLVMARHHVHHVPVLDGRTIVGMITSSDIAEHESDSAVLLAGAIFEQTRLEGLVQASTRIKTLQQRLAAAHASAHATGHIVSALTDALTTRLLQLAEADLGPAPVDYAWVAAGSQGRNEQTAKSDQDNCLIVSDDYDEALHGDFFRELSHRVCDGLAACGYVHCPGGMMAMTDAWRQPLSRWRHYFERWIELPEPEALMLTGVFLDQRFVYGRPEPIDALRAEVVGRAKDNKAFLAALAGNALVRQPPLNWLGRLALIKGGEHDGTIDLKMHATVPITDLARCYAYAAGSPAVNTRERLEAAAQSGVVTEGQARDLIDAFEFLCGLRLQHQARLVSEGHDADNFLAPEEEMSNFERSHLRDAMKLIGTMQGALAQAYPVNLI
ncbi:MAG: DUF294 nucleotidyltransferase-like domain-containing protein [Salinarimonas sp.]